MTRLIDLTRPLSDVDKSSFPVDLLPLLRIIAPEIEYVDHTMGARIMQMLFKCPGEHLPAGEGWGEEMLHMSSHLGTHVDAPWHYGSTCAGEKARTIGEIDVNELYCNAVVLDMSHKRGTGSAITIDDLQQALEKVRYKIEPGDAVLIRTDHDKYELTDLARYHYPGMIRESALWLAEQGAKIGGTDALGWDRPFNVMVEDYAKSGDKRFIWDAHFAYRDVEVFVVQQLINLHLLPPHGFKVACFPLRLEKTSAAPARVVAFLD